MGKVIKTTMKINNKLNEEEQTALIEYNDATKQAHETISEKGFIIIKQLRLIVIIQSILTGYLIFNG